MPHGGQGNTESRRYHIVGFCVARMCKEKALSNPVTQTMARPAGRRRCGALNECRTRTAPGSLWPRAVCSAGELTEFVAFDDLGSAEAAQAVEVGAAG